MELVNVQGMRRMVHPTGLYRFEKGGLLLAEFSAYEAGLARLLSYLREVLDNACIGTATDKRLARWEELLHIPPRQAMYPKERRALILARLGVHPNNYTAEGLVWSVRASGLVAQILERPGNHPLQVVCMGLTGGFIDMQQVLDNARTMLPAHLEIIFDRGMLTWDLFEERWSDWDAFEAEELTFEAFDGFEV